MPKRTQWSLHWLTLAVVLPLLVLAGFAWWGTQSQLKAAWAEAREEAERLAPVLAEDLAVQLNAGLVTVATYPEPPVPGVPSELDAVLDGTDLAALATLRDNPQAGLSPAGLPRRALAAIRLHELDRTKQSQVFLSKLLVDEVPSTLTEVMLERPDFLDGRKEWDRQEVIRRVARTAPDEDGWVRDPDGGIHWVDVQPDSGSIRYLDFSTALDQWNPHDRGLPRWAKARAHIGRTEGPVLASVPIHFGKDLALSIFPHRGGSALEEPVRRQQRWIFTMLGVSVITAMVALTVLHRTLRRERQLSEMKSQFVASVSHELRAPVASIRLMADALEAEKVAPETAKEFHRLIAREGARLSTLVGNVLDHARIEQGRKLWKMEPCDLSSLVTDTVRVMEPLAQEKGITLKQGLSAGEAVVDADAIQQALVNLLDNAIKFSPPGTAITVTLACDEERDTWRLSVSDQGPGIPKEEQSRIFERFYRPGDELRRETQGTGIGLSLVKSIAEAHGGTITVESERGKGSAFTLSGSAGLQGALLDHSSRSDDRRSREET
jgi:two-component system phosphate regulon sensor histidine kinase PhoR